MAKSPRNTAGGRLLQSSPHWFDNIPDIRKDIACIVILYIVILLLCNKIAFNDMIFADSNDTYSAAGFGKAVEHIQQTEKGDPLWIPYLFSGTPVFAAMIFTRTANFLESGLAGVGKVLFFGAGMSWILLHYWLNGIFMFLLARSLKFSQLPALFAALTVMLNPYCIELAEAGHGSKLMTLSFVPLMLMLTIRLFEKRDLLTMGLLAIASATMLLASHVQIAFYGFFLVGLYVLYQLVLSIKSEPANTAKAIAMFGVAILIGFAISAYVYLPTQEYAKYSIRGGGEGNVMAGLNFDYATNWSFHPAELFNYFVPTTFGMSSSYATEVQGTPAVLGMYWGWMPFTTSTVYVGIVPLLLAILALIYRRNRLTTWLAGVSVFFWLIAFGKFSPFVYDLMFNFFPFFNKFRIPVMILHLTPILIGLLAAYGLDFLFELPQLQKDINTEKLRKRLMYIGGGIAAILVFGTLAKTGLYSFLSGFMFSKAGEVQEYAQQVGGQQRAMQYVDMLREQRFELFWGGYLKFAVFACVSIGAVVLYLMGKMQRHTMALVCILIVSLDLLILDNYYINPKPNNAIEQAFTPDAVTAQLQAESDSSLFRVYPVEQFEDNTMMGQHVQSIGGYSPAKLKIYQEMRDSCNLDKGNLNVVSMLNVKYFIRAQRTQDGVIHNTLQQSPVFLPRAWFVDEVKVMPEKHDIFREMNSSLFNPKQYAILEKQPAKPVSKPTNASVSVASFASSKIELDATTDVSALMVLSEMYYPAGWTATIDGAPSEIYKTNYILRSLVVPPGKHHIVFEFNPKSYQLGYTITYAGWGVAVLLVLIGIAPIVRTRLHTRKLA